MKRFPHAKEDLLLKIKTIDFKNEIHIGKSIYKVRIKSSDQNKGKSGSLRCYIYVYVNKDLLAPLCIYSKNQEESISENQLQYHFDKIIEELIR
ncbi:MAG: hypothetical protein U1D98_02385 [Candidatus Gracilibacteria bacterium]|nr:hypothetical protein [Candidatus Gracilibacteria bacterium]